MHRQRTETGGQGASAQVGFVVEETCAAAQQHQRRLAVLLEVAAQPSAEVERTRTVEKPVYHVVLSFDPADAPVSLDYAGRDPGFPRCHLAGWGEGWIHMDEGGVPQFPASFLTLLPYLDTTGTRSTELARRAGDLTRARTDIAHALEVIRDLS